MMQLYAEHAEAGERLHIADVASQKEAATMVDAMEEAGTWPEGADAVLREAGAKPKEWMYEGDGTWTRI